MGRGRWVLASAPFPPYQSLTLAFMATPKQFPETAAPRLKTVSWRWSQAAGSAHRGWDRCTGLKEGNQAERHGPYSQHSHVTHADTHRAHRVRTPLYNQVTCGQGSRALRARPGTAQPLPALTADSAPHASTHTNWGGRRGGLQPVLCMSDLVLTCARMLVPTLFWVWHACFLCVCQATPLCHVPVCQSVSVLPPDVCFVPSWTDALAPYFPPRPCPRPQPTRTTDPEARGPASAQP